MWPFTRRLDTGVIERRRKTHGLKVKQFASVANQIGKFQLAQLFDRCSASLTCLDVDGEQTTLFELAPHLFEHRLQHLRHLRLYHIQLSEDDWPLLAAEFGPKLESLELEKCHIVTTSAPDDNVLQLEMGLFSRVGRLLIEETYGQLQSGDETKLVGASHPPNLMYYSLAYVEELWEWVRHAVVDCPRLRSLRINSEYAEPEDLTVAAEVLAQLNEGGLKELELVCYPPISVRTMPIPLL